MNDLLTDERRSDAQRSNFQSRLGHAPDPAPRTAVVGVSGYSGGELARLLLRHPQLVDQPPSFLGRLGTAADQASISLSHLHPHLLPASGEAPQVRSFTWDSLAGEVDVLFLATPHEQSREFVPEAVARGLRVIDLSGAWRLHEPANRSVYQLEDRDPDAAEALQAEAVYGCPELHRSAIAKARLVANPGCYATSILLALAPLVARNLVDLEHGIVCDAKSGVSGAGKTLSAKTHFMYAADNFSAYSVFGHRHTGELLEQLHLTAEQIQFTPHLLPIPRGILSTIYLDLKTRSTSPDVHGMFAEYFAASPMVRVYPPPQLPQIQNVVRTNFCDLGFELAPNGKRLVIVSCLDNLLKGAASQAVQNLNLMCGWDESEGLL